MDTKIEPKMITIRSTQTIIVQSFNLN